MATIEETRDLELFGVSGSSELLEVRITPAEGDKPAQLTGYAAIWNSLSADLGGFRERILPGAFRASLAAGQDIRALVDHDPSKILGRTSSGTLRLGENDKGLWVSCDLPDTSYARDLMVSAKRGDIRGMSFGFRVPQGGERFTTEGKTAIRELTAIDLREVTCTSIPAYGATSLSVRVDPGIAGRIQASQERPELARRQQQYRRALAA